MESDFPGLNCRYDLAYVQLHLLLPTSPSPDGSVSAQQLWPAQPYCCIHAHGGHSTPSPWEHEALLSLLVYMKNSCYLFISKSYSTLQPFCAVNHCLLGCLCTQGACCAVLRYLLMQCWSPPQDYEIPRAGVSFLDVFIIFALPYPQHSPLTPPTSALSALLTLLTGMGTCKSHSQATGMDDMAGI